MFNSCIFFCFLFFNNSFFQFFCLIFFLLFSWSIICLLWWSSVVSNCCLKKFWFQLFQFFSWAILILNNMFVVVVLWCVQLFLEVFCPKSFSPFLFLSFANYFLFFLAPLFWNSQKCPISQNIWCLIKTQWKKTCSIHTIFQVSSPWATLILNSMFVVVVLYCAQFFFRNKNVPKSFSPFLFLSFANMFLFFTFLAPFFWNSQKCPISQNIWCLIQTQF